MQFKFTGLFCLGCGVLLVLLFAASPATTTGMTANQRPEDIASEEVLVPAGQFLMGCSSDLYPEGCDTDTLPIHAVYLDAFYIDRTEVTNAQYNVCVAAGGCRERLHCESETRSAYCENPIYADFPVIGVDWWRALEFCTWAGRRLPTEAEWEKAARGTDMRKYPWGEDDATCERLNFMDGVWGDYHYCIGDTVAVGSYPASVSPYGALDMSGNVSEWVNDFYEKHYYYESPYFNPQGPETTVKREHLVRGGSWRENARSVTTVVRLDEGEIYNTLRIGIRCARSLSGSLPTPAPTPTPLPTPTPSPTPTPFAASTVGPEGGVLWMAYPGHLTLLNVPSGVVDANTVFTLAFDGHSSLQGDLQGIDHFFSVDTDPPLSGTLSLSDSARLPLELTLGFASLQGVIAETVNLYRLDSTDWLTHDIVVTEKTDTLIVAWIGEPGAYGVMGRTNRFFLPISLKGTP